MNIELLELAAAALGELSSEVVFVGGATVGLWITDLAAALPHAVGRELPSATIIRAVSPSYLLATKLEAFKGRGRGDFLGSRDFADIIALVDGREELIGEIACADDDLRQYLAEEVGALLAAPRFENGLYGSLLPDAASQERADTVVMPALRAIAEGGR